jgi:hypothetical protein
MNVAKGADYTDFFSRLQIICTLFKQKKPISTYRLFFISKLTATENDTTFAQVIRCHFYGYFIAR